MGKNDKGSGDIVLAKGGGLTALDAMWLRPVDVIKFSVYDHEETKLFGVLRDEMLLRRKGESQKTWEKRCEEVGEWNRRRSKLMTAVFIVKVAEKYGPESEGVKALVDSYGIALQFERGTKEKLPVGEMIKLITGGPDND